MSIPPRSPRPPCPPRSLGRSGRITAARLFLRRVVAIVALASMPLAPGCGTGEAFEGESLRLQPDRYDEAFSAAAAVLSDHGLSPAVRDRRAGVIETDPEDSAGWFAPWNIEPASSLEGVATLATVRRRARITFRPERFDPPAEDSELTGPDLFGLFEPPPGVETADAPIEMRVAVFVERSHRPGMQVDTWSRRLVNQARVGRPSPAEGFEPGRTWWPVARDTGLERAILGRIAARLGDAPAG